VAGPPKQKKEKAALKGQPANWQTYQAAADRAIEGSQAQEENGFKIELARNTLRRTLAESCKPLSNGEPG